MPEKKNILIGITGGISAYKVCSLVRMFKKTGANVRVIMTPSAENFVTKLTLQTLSQNEVYVNNFDYGEYKPEHIALCDEADVFLIAPASANTISKIANGICDNLLTTTACAYTKRLIIAPAMNTGMWKNPIIQENIEKLRSNGVEIIEPASGFLACSTTGTGRMAEPEVIFERVNSVLNESAGSQSGISGVKTALSGKRILVTAGGTKEKIDPVRYISNFSSGKMGLALADCAYEMGAEVTLISTFGADKPYKNIVAESAEQMRSAVLSEFDNSDCIIMAAAVADYRAENCSDNKIKKGSEDSITLKLVKNPDILQEISVLAMNSSSTPAWSMPEKQSAEGDLAISGSGSKKVIVGFCAESENLIENAKSKIAKKGCDFLAANDISSTDTGFSSDYNEIYLLDRKLNITHFERDTKQNIAKKILEKIFE